MASGSVNADSGEKKVAMRAEAGDIAAITFQVADIASRQYLLAIKGTTQRHDPGREGEDVHMRRTAPQETCPRQQLTPHQS